MSTALSTQPVSRSSGTDSRRLGNLYTAFTHRYAERTASGGRLFTEPDEVEARIRAQLIAYRATVGRPPILRRARMLEVFAESAIVRQSPDDLLAGSQKFGIGGLPDVVRAELQSLGYATNIGHIVHDFDSLLSHGVCGILEQIRARRNRQSTPDQRINLDGFERGMLAFQRFIQRHAESAGDRAADLRLIAEEPPRHFRQALQLAWFMQIFLHAENPAAAISFGRFDQYLWRFLEEDLAQGAITHQDACELIGAFYIRCCEGDESQNLALGGVDETGRDATNALSVIMLDVMRELRVFQPSLSVRLHAGSPAEFVRAAVELAAAGIGQPGFINDEAVIPGLQELGIPLERARDYGIVGCYEATTQGDCYPLTVAGGLMLPETLIGFLKTETAHAAADFDAFISGWFDSVAAAIKKLQDGAWQSSWNHWKTNAPSPFGSAVMKGCIDIAQPLEAGGARFNLFGVNIGGLGTTIDSLHAIRETVFTRKNLTLAEIAAAVDADFPDDALRRRLRNLPDRFGTDSEATNTLAETVSTRISRMVLDCRLANGVRPYPGLFRFLADVGCHPYATPDGRRVEENLSYGCGPCSAAPTTPTSVLSSTAHIAHRLCACGNPLALALTRKDVSGAPGLARLESLIKTYFALGGFHLHINIAGADDMRKAKADPVNHKELTVRISGLSARFVTLTASVQDALIERADHGV